jgi:antitoxin MazE
METKIQKWGNSLGVRIPSSIAKRQSIQAGSIVTVEETADAISIRVVKNKPETLAELVAQITPENQHPEVDWGEPRGKEIW